MSIITISRGTFSGGKEFAENLARKLSYHCLSREDLSEEAIKYGIPVGKLQTAMVKPPRIAKRLGPERDFYLSYITSQLCNYVLEGDLVYHGHTGHLLLPGIPNIFRVRILADKEYRISNVMLRLNLSREKAIEYIENVDMDRDKWVRFLYGVDWHDPLHYDLVVNLAQMEVANAATALCSMAELPDFKLTPASIKALNNLKLSNNARYLLARDSRTGFADFKVTADDGAVQVICMPHQAEVAQYVNEVLSELEDCKSVNCTIAGSNILWLGEQFTIESGLFKNLVKVAKKWDAAVEIMRYATDEKEIFAAATTSAVSQLNRQNGGIEDDLEEKMAEDSSGISQALDELMKEGCSGGISTIYGDKENLIANLGHRTNYRLVVIGDLFISKSESIRKRLTSELRSLMIDSLKAPVVGEEELKQEMKSGAKEFSRLGLFLIIAAVLFILVFTNQDAVLTFMAGESFKAWRILAIAALLLFIPVFAYSYGSTARYILKLFKLD